MFKAAKARLSEYVTPLFEKDKREKNGSSNSTEPFTRCKRPYNLDYPEPVGKRKRTDNTSSNKPLMSFLGSWSNVFRKTSIENDGVVDLTHSQNQLDSSISELHFENEEDTENRKILTATRKKQSSRLPLVQISEKSVFDCTNLGSDDDVSSDIQITKVSLDLTKSLKERGSQPIGMNLLDDVKLTKIAVDLTTDTNCDGDDRRTNLVGPLARQKSAGLLDETIRLDEKMRYKTLLAHFTNVNLPEYSQSIFPVTDIDVMSSNFDSVNSLSSNSWFGRKYSVKKPVYVDLTGNDAESKRQAAPRRKFFYELLSKPKVSSSSKMLGSSQSSSKSSECLGVSFERSEFREEPPACSGLLDPDWIQKWRDTIDPMQLERDRRIDEEEKRKEALKRKQKEDFEELQKKLEEKAKDVEFVKLTDEMNAIVKKALAPGNPRDVFVEGFNAEVTRADISSLRHSTWLNDEVVNFYFNLLKERSEKDGNLPKVHMFNTFFYPKIMKTGHAGVKRWTRKVDIFSFDLILIPVHLGMHWCLAVVDLKKKEIAYYDSLKGNNTQCILALKKYLNDESKEKKKCEFDFDGWTEVMPKNIPEQMNGCDCGVFMCKYAEYRSRNCKFTFSQANMPYFRNRMIYEIISKKLL